MNRKELGKRAEEFTRKILISRGYKIIETNFKCRIGEIDIIAKDNDILTFIEVRSKKNCNYGYPQETVDYKKQAKIKKVAEYYLMVNNLFEVSCRFDVVAIVFEPKLKYEIIKDAF